MATVAKSVKRTLRTSPLLSARRKTKAGSLNSTLQVPRNGAKQRSKPVVNLLLLADGTVQGLYTEEVDLTTLGTILTCNRVSNVDWESGWWVARRVEDGVAIAQSTSRSEVLQMEAEYFTVRGKDLLVGRK